MDLQRRLPESPRYLDDDALIDRVLGHIDRETTDLAGDSWREPVEHYRSPRRLAREVAEVLRRVPVAFCPSAALPESGSFHARVAAGVPIVVVRGRDGQVRGFRNACRHRGAAVVGGSGCARALVCPYHGWIYGLDGSLRHVPDAHGFPDLERASRALVSVRTVEHGGLVFVDQDGRGAEADLVGGVGELIGPDQAMVEHTEAGIDVNWKVFAEGFLEGYHLRATHRETFLPSGYANLTVVEHRGPHSRVTFPFRRIERLRGQPAGARSIDGAVAFVDHLFPNVMVARLSHHTTVVVVEPVTVNRSTVVTYRLTNRRPADGGDQDARRDRDFVALGAAEDLAVAMAVQHGLASGANDALEFGRFEGALGHLHRQLADRLDTTEVAVP